MVDEGYPFNVFMMHDLLIYHYYTKAHTIEAENTFTGRVVLRAQNLSFSVLPKKKLVKHVKSQHIFRL